MPKVTKRSAEAARAAADRFVRNEIWNGLVAGDPVRVRGIRGGRFRFRCHVQNTAAGSSWIEVDELERVALATEAPASSPVRRVRAFEEDRVSRLGRARRSTRRAPTSSAPPAAGLDKPAAEPAKPATGLDTTERPALPGLLGGEDVGARQLALFDTPGR